MNFKNKKFYNDRIKNKNKKSLKFVWKNLFVM
jgi:hypothetical protein